MTENAPKAGGRPSPWGAIRRKRGSQFPEKKNALLRQAAALFRERGYDGASLSDLADILNITKPTLYYYVSNKDHLVLEINKIAQQVIVDHVKHVDATAEGPCDKLFAIMRHYAEFMTTDLGVCVALVPPRSMTAENRALMEARADEANQILYRIIRRGQQEKVFKEGDPAIICQTLFGALNHTGAWFNRDGPISVKDLAAFQVEILLCGLRRGSTDN